MKYLLLLMIYYNGPRVDVISTEIYFDTIHQCSIYRLTEKFQDRLRKKYSNSNVRYIRPFCRPIATPDDTYAIRLPVFGPAS